MLLNCILVIGSKNFHLETFSRNLFLLSKIIMFFKKSFKNVKGKRRSTRNLEILATKLPIIFVVFHVELIWIISNKPETIVYKFYSMTKKLILNHWFSPYYVFILQWFMLHVVHSNWVFIYDVTSSHFLPNAIHLYYMPVD